MSTHIDREFELARKDEHEARALLDTATEAGRDLTAEEEARFDALIASAEKHDARANSLVASEKRAAEFATLAAGLVTEQPETVAKLSGINASLIENITTVQRAYRQNGSFDGELWASGLVDLEKRAIADFSDNGALYTTDFATQVAVYQRTASPWINLASVINADNGRPINLPNLTADPTVYTPGEGTAITESTPTLGSAALTTTAYKALSYVSMEAEQDELIGLLGLIARVQGRAIGYQFGTALTATIVAAATNGGTATAIGGNGTAAGNFLGFDDLVTLEMGLPVPYRASAAYVASNDAIKRMKKWKDGQGQYLWQAPISAGAPARINGYPIYEDPGLAAAASASKSVLFGDPTAVVVKQMALRVATSTEFRFSNDQVAIKSVYRAGGALPDGTAIRYLVSANT